MVIELMTKYVDWNDVPLVLGTQEAADLMGVHVNTVKNLITNGELKSFRIGRVLKVHKDDIRRFMGLSVDDGEE